MATGPLVLAGSKFEFQTRQMPLMLNFCFRKFMHNRPPVDVKMKIKKLLSPYIIHLFADLLMIVRHDRLQS